ncbi:clustered mitochondria protein-like isoform X2 [Impatiens glandulifera]|uniref:clustered mitochondria protein-like isoform X2 n=1 Tax=Impatiens glandulifera TaxID=253017 RepID=UPI001FB0F697|nr:clustered mitochondria protein-like isoform X2 [Impatiens glandulifera]
MAGKTNKGRNRKSSQNAPVPAAVAAVADDDTSQQMILSDAPIKPELSLSDVTNGDVNGNVVNSESNDIKEDIIKVSEDNADLENQETKQGEVQLYPVTVKTQGGEKLDLQLNPGDSVIDIRQFLLEAHETCHFTCYDLFVHKKDGSIHQLEDHNEISEVADITTADCSFEMVAALYDDRSIRSHVDRSRDLLSLSSLHSSLSTSLALQHEIKQKTPSNSDPAKIEVPELDNLGFMEDVTSSITSLLSSPSNEIKSVENIVFSSLNPPPSYRRLVGDLIYLDVVTLEGNTYCITGTTKMFYVNSSTGNTLDPKPSKASSESATLIGLLQKISSKFKRAYREILERKAMAHPFENVQSILPPNSWLGLYPLQDHKRDSARAESAVNLTFGNELVGMQRDWNEEVQSCREFPHSTPQERILRDRALYKVTSDFVDAAINGAIGVISKCIQPINPTDPECLQMYVHNNIFFSFAVDADLEKLSRKRGEASSESATVSIADKPDASDASDGAAESATVSIADKPDASDASDGAVERQLNENERATYASANNDLKGTKAYQEADVPGLYNLAMAIIDYRGHRVVAQSVLPGILQGDKSDSLLYGSVDNGKKIFWNEDFHLKVVESAKRLHMKEHSVCDGSGNVFKLAAPVECKGIVGSDERQYLLDMVRVTPRDANYTEPGSRFCILRPELINAFLQARAAERSKSCQKQVMEPLEISGSTEVKVEANNATSISEANDAALQECDSAKEGNQEISEDLYFNPNVFTDFKLSGNEEEIAVDEENVRKASSYLRDVVLPKFIQDLCTLNVSPMDGQTLTEALHAHGINNRYIGKVAEGIKHLPHFLDLCLNEIVVRSAKHIMKYLLRETEDHDLAAAVSHFLNCFFGNCQVASLKGASNASYSRSQKQEHTSDQTSGRSLRSTRSTRKKQSSFLSMTSASLWMDIVELAKLKYQFELPEEDARSRAKKIFVVRNFCKKIGLTIAARKYDLDTVTPFQPSDILNLQPVVKHSIPICSEAKELIETGKLQLSEGMLGEAYTIFSKAFTILQQVTGPMHREVANCCRYLAMVLYHAGDMAGAIMQQHKELIINERCLGLDHPDTYHSYGNMALFYHGLNQNELALRHMSRAMALVSLSSGPDHPDVAATFINVAMMYQDIGNMNTALRYLQEAMIKNERLLGDQHIQTAGCYHALAITFNCMGAFKISQQHEKKTYDILVKILGENDSRTLDSLNWLNTFKMHQLQMNTQKQRNQALNAASAQKAIDMLKAHPNLMQVFQAAAIAGGNSNVQNNPVTVVPLSRGRGIDERATRAAAEVRKKAANRGILNKGVPVLKVANVNGMGLVLKPKGLGNSLENQSKKEHPVGLGTGLTSLDAKKNKGKV